MNDRHSAAAWIKSLLARKGNEYTTEALELEAAAREAEAERDGAEICRKHHGKNGRIAPVRGDEYED